MKGIDVSYWQDNIEWSKAKKDGVQFAVLREGYRNTIDKRFIENVKGCQKNGIAVMVYHFIYTDNASTVDNAKSTVANMKAAGLDIANTWIFADLEYDTWKRNGETCTREKCSLYTLEYIKALEKLGCKKIGVYMNIDYYKNYYTDDIKKNYKIWLADYNGEADFSCSMQQYTSSGKVSGINGNVDMNTLFDTSMLSKSDNKEENKTMGYDRTKVVAQAQSWLGCKESDGSHRKIIDLYNTQNPRPRSYKVQYTDAWCATFVSAVAVKLGYTRIIPTECSCNYMIKGFQNIGCWVENDAYVPKAGDIIFYDWQDTGSGDNTGSSDHVGIVEKCDGKTITVIEGNMSNKVGRRTLAVNGKYIRGFGVPKYDTESVPSGSDSSGKKSLDEIAREVLSGAWGNGDDRKNRLTAAGYDYNAVQSRVNQLASGSSSGTTKKSVSEVAKEVLAGAWGNGDDRKKKLIAAGYDYSAVQSEVNRLCNKKSVDTIAREVIAGKWGNGDTRKKKLQAAGYNYSEVQKRVNQLL